MLITGSGIIEAVASDLSIFHGKGKSPQSDDCGSCVRPIMVFVNVIVGIVHGAEARGTSRFGRIVLCVVSDLVVVMFVLVGLVLMVWSQIVYFRMEVESGVNYVPCYRRSQKWFSLWHCEEKMNSALRESVRTSFESECLFRHLKASLPVVSANRQIRITLFPVFKFVVFFLFLSILVIVLVLVL